MLESAARLFVRGLDLEAGEQSPAITLLPERSAVDASAIAVGRAGEISVPVVLSAYAPAALGDRCRSLAEFVRGSHNVRVRDLSYTTTRRRAHLEHRMAVVAATRDELVDRLEAFARGEERANTSSGRAGDASRHAWRSFLDRAHGGGRWAGALQCGAVFATIER